MPIYQLFFFLTIILLPTQLGLHLWPDWALVLGRRIDYLAPTIYITDITLLLTLLTYVIQQRLYKRSVVFIRHNSIVIISILACVTVNIVNAATPFISIMKWGKVLEYLLFFLYIYKTKPSLRITIYCFLIASAYSSVIALTQFALQHTIGGVFWFLGERTFTSSTPGIAHATWCWFSQTTCVELLRPYATFSHPNVLGGFLAATLPLLLWQRTKEKKRILRLILIGSVILGMSTLLITFSRSAWLVGTAMLIGTIWLLPSKKTWVVRTTACVLLCGGLYFLSPYIQTLTKGNESVFMRIDLIKAALELFAKHPIFGVGLGMFLPSLPQVLSVRDLYFLQPVHTIYLLYLAETGLSGIALFCFAAYTYVRALTKQKQVAILLLPCITLALLGVVDHYPLSVQQGQLLTTGLLALPFLYKDS